MKQTLFAISIAGLIFSGYLGGTKLLTGTCALNESCPNFLGYPACFYGFFMFLAITIGAGMLFFDVGKKRCALHIVLWVSLLGVLFAGYFTVKELPLLFAQGLSAYLLGLPTCAFGLFMYLALIFVASKVKAQEKIGKPRTEALPRTEARL